VDNGREIRDWTDSDGRMWRSLCTPETPADKPWLGVRVGPLCDLTSLGLPFEQEIRLHNQLHARGIFTEHDARRKGQDVIGAVMATFKVDAGRVIETYALDALD
jgi:hypothetical protein